MDAEEWKPIDGYNGYYLISNHGRVKSLKNEEKILKPDTCNKGYLRLTLSIKGVKTKYSIHQLVANYFIDKPNDYNDGQYIINHLDEDKTNNHYKNLQYTTIQENVEYSSSKYYICTSPDGIEYEVFNLSEFCRSHNLNISGMSRLATGRQRTDRPTTPTHYKGWQCRYQYNSSVRGVNKINL